MREARYNVFWVKRILQVVNFHQAWPCWWSNDLYNHIWLRYYSYLPFSHILVLTLAEQKDHNRTFKNPDSQAQQRSSESDPSKECAGNLCILKGLSIKWMIFKVVKNHWYKTVMEATSGRTKYWNSQKWILLGHDSTGRSVGHFLSLRQFIFYHLTMLYFKIIF